MIWPGAGTAHPRGLLQLPFPPPAPPASQVDDLEQLQALGAEEVKRELRARAAQDVSPEPGPEAQFIRQEMSLQGYRHLLSITSLDGLVEASRCVGGVGVGPAGPWLAAAWAAADHQHTTVKARALGT
jgi:hypothetical protein